MSDILIVRQPVFDRTDSAAGYELRFRAASDEGDPFARSYLSGSFDVLRSGLPAYVRCTRQQLLGRIFDSAEPSSLVVLVPPDVGVDGEVVAAVEALTKAGVVTAVDEFDGGIEAVTALEGLLGVVSQVRVDLRCYSPHTLRPVATALRAQKKKLRMPLADVLERINLAPEAREALLDRTGPFGDALNFVEAYELGLWEQATAIGRDLGVPAERIAGIYTDAVKWASDQLSPNALNAA